MRRGSRLCQAADIRRPGQRVVPRAAVFRRSDSGRTGEMTKTMAWVVVALLALVIASGSPPGSASADEASLVFVDPVRIEPLDQTVPVIGRLVACRAGIVAARVGGAVAQISVEVGDRVEAGETLAVIDRDRFAAEHDLKKARVVQAEAEIAAAEAEAALRRQELARIERLRRSPAFNEGRFEDKRQEVAMADGALGQARAELASAEAELRLARIALRETEVRAPYEGVVSRRHTEIGSHVDGGGAIVSLVNDRCVEIEADVPAARLGGLVPGTRVAFRLEDTTGNPVAGVDIAGSAFVRAVVPEENPLTRTRIARFEVDSDEIADVAAGRSVVVAIPAGEGREVVTVHKDALLTRHGQRVVFVVVDGTAESRSVQLGESVGSRFEVVDGLSAGDLAVVRGNERLRAGQAVRIGGASAPAPAAAGTPSRLTEPAG